MRTMSDGEWMDRLLEARRREREIRCPSCDLLQANDDGQYPVSYWGTDGWEEHQCDDCDTKFEVCEQVERTYEVRSLTDGQEVQAP